MKCSRLDEQGKGSGRAFAKTAMHMKKSIDLKGYTP